MAYSINGSDALNPMKVRIYTEPVLGTVNLAFLVQKNGLWHMAKPVELVFEPVNDYDLIKPTMAFAHGLAEEFLKAMATALDDRGIKPDSTAKVEGKLEATKYHLEDMRGMLAWFTQQGDGE